MENTTVTKKIAFDRRILFLGCGAVTQCTLPLVLRHLDMPADRITVLEMKDNRAAIADALKAGVQYVKEQITQEGYAEQLGKYVGAGDLIIDLAWNLGCTDLLAWCREKDVMYVNTSVELWDPYENRPLWQDRTLYARHMALRKMMAGWSGKGPTAVLDHGANPGLVSHFTKMALLDIGKKIVAEKPYDPRAAEIRDAVEKQTFNRLAQLIGLKTIHISERDTQVTNRPKEVNEFVNTWSVEGFYEEGTAPAEMGWGTHEQHLPPAARLHTSGPRNQICLASFGIDTWVRSWVPCGEIMGMVVRHGEAFSISENLTVNGYDGTPVYRPTVHYAYCPCDMAIASLHELRMRNYVAHENWRIMGDDITSGRDELGCLLMGHDFKSWWIGSLLDIEETRRLVPHQNATTLQVAASVLGALFWMIRNRREGVKIPDQLPHEEVMEVALPYLAPVISKPVDWMPAGPYPADDPRAWEFMRFFVTSTPRE
jgi:homospermidine synthase